MAVEILIKRRVKQGSQARQLIPLILQLRAMATFQPGYISGESLRDMEHPEECLVISTWESIECWNEWKNSKERLTIQKKIEDLVGEKTKYSVYEPMVMYEPMDDF